MAPCLNQRFGKDNQPFDCRKCITCRIKRQEMLCGLILAEAQQHTSTAFLSLTIDDQHLIDHGPSVRIDIVQKFLKRLRYKFPHLKITYSYAGEYGTRRDRPHYHIILYGFPTCEQHYNRFRPCECELHKALRKCWKLGHIDIKPFEPNNATYITKDIVKHLLKTTPPLGDRTPEFYRASKTDGGIGAAAADLAADTIKRHILDNGRDIIDVPTHLRHGSSLKPLPRARRVRMRRRLGRADNTPETIIKQNQERLDQLWSLVDGITNNSTCMKQYRRQQFADLQRDANEQRARNQIAKRLIHKGPL